MSHTEKPIPAVPVGSADLNQGPTASPMGRGDVIQVLLPNMARTATHKPRTNKDKVTELHLATYNVRTDATRLEVAWNSSMLPLSFL